MIVSRCLTLGRLSTNVAKNLLVQDGKTCISQQIKRHSHSHKQYYYRSSPVGDYPNKKMYDALGAVIWWWVLWHLFTDYHEIVPYSPPDPSKWTDEELGIPPLDK